MNDLILICIIAPVFVFGYFVAKGMDRFLDENGKNLDESEKK